MLNALLLAAMLADPVLAPSALNSMPSFPAGIVSAPVYDQNGQMLGTVAQARAAPGGKPLAIAVAPVSGAPTQAPVIVPASAASYDQGRNMVVVSGNALPARS